jgi:hypothetical protein
MIWAKVVYIITKSIVIIISGTNKSSIKLRSLIQDIYSLNIFFNNIIVRNDEYTLAGVLDMISRTTIASENTPKGLNYILVL